MSICTILASCSLSNALCSVCDTDKSASQVPIRNFNYWTVLSINGARFLTGGVFECDIAHRRLVCSIMYTVCNPMHPLYGAPPVPVRFTRGALVAHRSTRLLASEPHSTAGLLFPLLLSLDRFFRPSIRWCGTGGFQVQGQSFFICLSCSLLFSLLLFSLSLPSFYRLVL